MNTKLFNDLMNITRKNVSNTWSSEDYIDVGFLRGKFQPTGGQLSTVNGKSSTNLTAIFYCPIGSDIETGDIIYDQYGRSFVVMEAPPTGASGFMDHMEVGLVQR